MCVYLTLAWQYTFQRASLSEGELELLATWVRDLYVTRWDMWVDLVKWDDLVRGGELELLSTWIRDLYVGMDWVG